MYGAFIRGDLSRVLEAMDPEIEWRINPSAPEAGTHHGHHGVVVWSQDVADGFSEFKVEPQEFMEAGAQVVVPVRIRTRGRGSGATTELLETHVWTLCDGKAVRMQAYAEKSEALEAVGLRE
jgi:ketosteroid isomerase-like protein